VTKRVAKLVARLIELGMKPARGYQRAFARVKRIKPISGFDASKRVPRERIYDCR
jgi:hypothetical protein